MAIRERVDEIASYVSGERAIRGVKYKVTTLALALGMPGPSVPLRDERGALLAGAEVPFLVEHPHGRFLERLRYRFDENFPFEEMGADLMDRIEQGVYRRRVDTDPSLVCV